MQIKVHFVYLKGMASLIGFSENTHLKVRQYLNSKQTNTTHFLQIGIHQITAFLLTFEQCLLYLFDEFIHNI